MALTLYPAIDIKDGRAVRLEQGKFDHVTVFNDNPGDQARIWAHAGFSWVHVVDLDGALTGDGANARAVGDILAATEAKVQLGGGIRTRAHIDAWLEMGIARVILGTAAVRDPDLVRQAAGAYPGRVAVGIDVRAGKVAVQGWAEETDIGAVALAKRFEDAGVAAIIVTDIDRDGLGVGLNVELTGGLADAVDIPVIASGGLGSVADLERIQAWQGARAISGAILGRALYDGRVDVARALEIAG